MVNGVDRWRITLPSASLHHEDHLTSPQRAFWYLCLFLESAQAFLQRSLWISAMEISMAF